MEMDPAWTVLFDASANLINSDNFETQIHYQFKYGNSIQVDRRTMAIVPSKVNTPKGTGKFNSNN